MSSPAKSPKAVWRRPSEIMKLHRRKRRSSIGINSNMKGTASPQTALTDSTNLRVTSGKRRNPFGCNADDLPEAKKQNVCSVEDITDDHDRSINNENNVTNSSISNKLFQALDDTDKVAEKKVQADDKKIEERPRTEGFSPSLNLQEERTKELNRDAKEQTEWESDPFLPQDYCLKQKVRFMSPKSFSWCCTLKSLEEAQGMNDFIRQEDPVHDVDDRTAGKEFQRCVMYWIHPNLPWVKLFPRITGDNNRMSRPSLRTTDDEVHAALRTDWAESFTSIFYMLRAGYCPYFYLCAHQFTAVFLRPGGNGQTMKGILTPTTRGFREALSNEGIEFTLPLLEKQKSDTVTQTETDCPEIKVPGGTADEELDSTDDAAASVWLESIGLNKAHFPSLDPNMVKVQRESFKLIDNRPQSLVLVEGSSVQALFNFMLNWRSCVASSGPQLGLPPTLLSPVGFRGATLKSLKVKQSSVKLEDEDGVVRHHSVLELCGPILPHSMQSLCELFKSRQDGHFSATCHNHEATAPFNSALENTAHHSDNTNAEVNHTPLNRTMSPVSKKNVSRSVIKELEYSQNKFYFKS